jgi:hypothetical protein
MRNRGDFREEFEAAFPGEFWASHQEYTLGARLSKW